MLPNLQKHQETLENGQAGATGVGLLPLELCSLDCGSSHLHPAIPRHDRINNVAYVEDQELVQHTICHWRLL